MHKYFIDVCEKFEMECFPNPIPGGTATVWMSYLSDPYISGLGVSTKKLLS